MKHDTAGTANRGDSHHDPFGIITAPRAKSTGGACWTPRSRAGHSASKMDTGGQSVSVQRWISLSVHEIFPFGRRRGGGRRPAWAALLAWPPIKSFQPNGSGFLTPWTSTVLRPVTLFRWCRFLA